MWPTICYSCTIIYSKSANLLLPCPIQSMHASIHSSKIMIYILCTTLKTLLKIHIYPVALTMLISYIKIQISSQLGNFLQKRSLTLSCCLLLIRGPWVMPGSSPLPIFSSVFIARVKRLTNSSWIDSWRNIRFAVTQVWNSEIRNLWYNSHLFLTTTACSFDQSLSLPRAWTKKVNLLVILEL